MANPLLLFFFLGACQPSSKGPSLPETDAPENVFSVALPKCKDGQLAVVRQRGTLRPNSDQVDALSEPSGLHGCANEGLLAQVQIFLNKTEACITNHENSECMRNTDCGDGQICWCAGVIDGGAQPDGIWRHALGQHGQWDVGYRNKCLPLDCPKNCDGLGCAVARDICGRAIGLKCHTTRDECGASIGFCPNEGGHQQCSFSDSKSAWVCEYIADCD